MCIWGSPDVIPHLTRCHSKYNTLENKNLKKKTNLFPGGIEQKTILVLMFTLNT